MLATALLPAEQYPPQGAPQHIQDFLIRLAFDYILVPFLGTISDIV